jgi:hypothetical protein
MSKKNTDENSYEHEKELNDSNYVMLVDSTTTIDVIKKILQQEKIKEIISFDYESHKLLKQSNIPHVISDNFSSRNELIEIQNNCYEYVKWFEDDKIKQLTDYDGVNLGLLIQTELNYFLVQFVKKFFEIAKVFTKNNSATFFTSPTLFESIKIHTNSVIKINSENNIGSFYYDTLKIPLKIGERTITLRLSKNQFNILRKISDSISGLLSNYRLDKNKKTILLVEFNPLRFKKFFENLSTVPLNFLMINRQKPAIWNFSSFSILRRSGCGIISTNSMSDKITKNRIKEKLPGVNSQIQSMWKYDDFFRSFFSMRGISFWEALKPFFKDLFTKRALESISEIEMAKRIFEKHKFDSILIWSEIGPIEQILVKLAKRSGIKIILLQHGLFYDSESVGANNMNKFQGIYPVDADRYVIWGKVEEKNQIKHGTPMEKLMVLGSPLYDEIPDVEKEDNLHDYILLATSGPVKENALDLTIETIEKNQQTIKKICEVITKMNKKLIIKIHPSPDEFDPSDMAKEISRDIIVTKTGDIGKLTRSCDVFIVVDASTVILDAHLLKKPVISVLVKDSDYGVPSVLNQSCLLTDMNNFEITLKKVLTDEDLRKTMIEKGTIYVNEYLVNQGTASTNLLKFLNTV